MPLLPRARRRLLGEDGTTATPPPPRSRRAAPLTQNQPTIKFNTQKSALQPRAASVASEASVASAAPSASTRSHGKATSGKVRANAIVLDESDEDEAVEPVHTTRSGRSGATSTLEGDGTRSSARSTQTASAGRRKLLPADDDDGGMVSLPTPRGLY